MGGKGNMYIAAADANIGYTDQDIVWGEELRDGFVF